VVAALADGRPVELKGVDSPLDPIRVEVADERLLRPDGDGGLHLNLSVSDPLQAGGQARGPATGDEKWTLEYLEVEIVGTAGGP
jgi:hypothetical protein